MIDPGQLARNAAYGVVYRSSRLVKWLLGKWSPDSPEFQQLQARLSGAVQEGVAAAYTGFRPAPSTQGPPGGPASPAPAPSGPPLYVQPGGNVYDRTCPGGYVLFRVPFGPGSVAVCILQTTPGQELQTLATNPPPLGDWVYAIP